MKNKKYILSSCGTSLLTNGADPAGRKLIYSHANAVKKEDVPLEDLTQIEAIIEEVRQRLTEANTAEAAGLSAEINGISKILEISAHSRGDFHQLLSTDTWLGETTAGLVRDWLENRYEGIIVDVLRHPDLQTKDMAAFQLSLTELVRILSRDVPSYAAGGYRIIFNLTGGFKSVQGFLQSIANFYADETVYVFETAGELMRIPRLPVRMDAQSAVENNITPIRNLVAGIQGTDVSGVPEMFLFSMEDETVLSPWGELIWSKAGKQLYAERLFPSPRQEVIRYSARFEKDAAALAPDRLVMVNTRIDQLNRHLAEPAFNPPSLDFKQIKGKSAAPSTHEMDAWSDKDAQRIFCRFEGGVLILDRLDKGLH